MVTQNDIVAAVSAAILKKYPSETVYTNVVPNKFLRPSFLVETTNLSVMPSTVGAITFRCVAHIVCFENVDEYHNSQLEALNIRQLAVFGLFAPLYLKVGDRALKVTKLDGGSGGSDWIDVTVAFEWDVDLSEFAEIKVLPTMEEILLKMEGNT